MKSLAAGLGAAVALLLAGGVAEGGPPPPGNGLLLACDPHRGLAPHLKALPRYPLKLFESVFL